MRNTTAGRWWTNARSKPTPISITTAAVAFVTYCIYTILPAVRKTKWITTILHRLIMKKLIYYVILSHIFTYWNVKKKKTTNETLRSISLLLFEILTFQADGDEVNLLSTIVNFNCKEKRIIYHINNNNWKIPFSLKFNSELYIIYACNNYDNIF